MLPPPARQRRLLSLLVRPNQYRRTSESFSSLHRRQHTLTQTLLSPACGLALRSVADSELVFDDLRVPAANLIGAEGKGFQQQMMQFQNERMIANYLSVGSMEVALERTVEYLRIPRNVLTICLGKSTYARCGIIVNVTPLEPEWEGHVTLEFSNTTSLPAKIYANEGVAQFLFFESDEACETSYADRKGKYQGQTGVTLPKA